MTIAPLIACAHRLCSSLVLAPHSSSPLPSQFFESLIRVATLKSLPTDDEISAAGFEDAGQLMLRLQLDAGGSDWSDFLASHELPVEGGPAQPIDRALDHLIALMIRSIHIVAMGARTLDNPSLELSADAVKTFAKSGGRGGVTAAAKS